MFILRVVICGYYMNHESKCVYVLKKSQLMYDVSCYMCTICDNMRKNFCTQHSILFKCTHNNPFLSPSFNQTDEWRLSEVNKDFSVCPSYPPLVAVPKDIDDDALRKVATFRHGGRFPVLSYYHKKNGMVSAQEMTLTFPCGSDVYFKSCVQFS